MAMTTQTSQGHFKVTKRSDEGRKGQCSHQVEVPHGQVRIGGGVGAQAPP